MPMQQTNNFRHDALHFVKIKHAKKEHCFVIDGLPIQENPDNLLSKWIILLADEKATNLMFDGIRVRDKKKGINKHKSINLKEKKN